jgi:hypothetical protein
VRKHNGDEEGATPGTKQSLGEIVVIPVIEDKARGNQQGTEKEQSGNLERVGEKRHHKKAKKHQAKEHEYGSDNTYNVATEQGFQGELRGSRRLESGLGSGLESRLNGLRGRLGGGLGKRLRGGLGGVSKLRGRLECGLRDRLEGPSGLEGELGRGLSRRLKGRNLPRDGLGWQDGLGWRDGLEGRGG